ncbi:Protein yceI precursor [hydrothermal vent metagenome]|uniref:Protein yceI n=1 Tax=hydrothermal vent metagenome TaxID=652676 RepID=A0A3B1BG71_9ZZZZ
MNMLKHKFIRPFFSAVIIGSGLMLSQISQAEPAKAGHYVIDSGHASAIFSISHLGYSELQGRFNELEGEFDLNPAGRSKLEVRIKTASIDTNHKKRDEHLRSPDFFNARQYPLISFTSTEVKYNDKGEPVSIIGKLNMHGKTRPLTLTVKAMRAATDPWGSYRAGYSASVRLKRSDFGMDFMQGGIGDEVSLKIDLETIRK